MLDGLDSKLLLNLSHVPQVIWVNSGDRHVGVSSAGCISGGKDKIALARVRVIEVQYISGLRPVLIGA